MCNDRVVEIREQHSRPGRSRLRVVAMAVVGILVTVGVGVAGFWPYAATIGWAAACVVYISWVWTVIGKMDARATATHATREDPARATSEVLIVLAGTASLVAVAFVLVQAKGSHGSTKDVLASIAVLSVALSWFLVHTLFTLRYARLYYTGVDGGIDFNQKEPPSYLEFAYLSFTIGMTFQVSDTNLEAPDIRATALRHGLLSFVFGSVVLATTINLIASLAG